MANVPDSVQVTPGQGPKVAIYDFTDTDTIAKIIQRNTLNDPYGVPVGQARNKAVAVTPTVSVGTSYGANYVEGGVLHFAAVFGDAGSGVVQFARATCKQLQQVGVTLFLFSANPISSTLSDALAAAINAADASLSSYGDQFVAEQSAWHSHDSIADRRRSHQHRGQRSLRRAGN